MSVVNASQILGPQTWRETCRAAISGLLDHAETYTTEAREGHLVFIDQYVTPWIGPKHAVSNEGDDTPFDLRSPIEASINFTSKNAPTVRFQFEPLAVTKLGRSSEDKFARERVKEMLSQTINVAKKVDLRWSYQFVDALFPASADEIARMYDYETALPFPLEHAPIFNMAFDLDGSERKMKTYFLPMAKAFATNRTGESITFDVIRNLTPFGETLTPTVDMLESYFHSTKSPLTIDMIGLDAADPSNSRIKVYSHVNNINSWSVVEHVCTFGGQATDMTRLEGLKLLRSIWDLLLDREEMLKDSDAHIDVSKALRLQNSFLGSVMFSFEVVPGHLFPDVKVYLPLWQYATSDQRIADNLTKAFETLGWQDIAKNYSPRLKQCFPGADLHGRASLHSNLSFAFSPRSGAYMSVYYAVSSKSVQSST